MKILVCGPEDRYARYRPAETMSAELVFCPVTGDLRQAAAANPDAAVLFADPMAEVDAELLALLPELRLIQSEGVAFHRFDLEAARQRGVYVCNCKGCNASSVAEHTVMLMLMALRYGISGHEAVRDGRQFAMKEQVMVSGSPELSECTVGIVGLGDIGTATARRLQPFGCRLLYYSPHRKSDLEAALGLTWLPLNKLVQQCDILSLHCAVNEQTRGLVNRELLAQCKPGMVLVNTARGDLLDNQAVREALLSGRLSALAVDTLSPEPTPADHPLVDLPPEVRDRAIYSPHLGGNTGGAFRRAHQILWDNAGAIAEGRRPRFIVNNL